MISARLNQFPWSAATGIPDDMVAFGGGVFEMGSDDGAPAERPRHLRYVEPFLLDKYLTTNGEFSRFIKETRYETTCERVGSGWTLDAGNFRIVSGVSWRNFATPDRSDHPVVLVSWDDANAFATWKGRRLPTEAEWEFAARLEAGDSRSFGMFDAPVAACAAGRQWRDGPGTAPVGSFPSHTGAFDLVGNVWQWCADIYAEDAYSGIGKEPRLGTETIRSRRGGAWNVMQTFRLRCANRGAYHQSGSAPNIGFRCAV